MRARRCALAIAVGISLVRVAGAAEPERLAPGDHSRDIGFAGLARSFVLHLPPAATGGAPLPLVIAFHGGGGNAEGFQAYAGLDAVSDREGFAVVYPNGTSRAAADPSTLLPPRLRRLFTWNAGGCCGFAMDENVDDVAFARRVVSAVAELAPIDRARVYATGHSNGAMLAYRLAAEAADEIAAIAPVAGAMNLRAAFAPSRAVPVLHVHSVDDPRARYDGGETRSFAGIVVHHEPVMAGLRAWQERNGCSGPSRELERRRAPAASGAGEQTAVHLAATCPASAPVELWKLGGVGHGWPGETAGPLPERLVGPHGDVIDAAEEAWKFFARFGSPGAAR
jgi:polyhydroxybutyrate depolymerase